MPLASPQEPVEASASLRHPSRGATPARWVQAATLLRWFMVCVFVVAGCAKLFGWGSMISLFHAVGFGQWFRYVIGAGELTGAILLAIPATAWPGTFLLSVLMIGAAGTEIFILRRLPVSSSATLLALVVVAMTSLRPAARR